MDNKIIMIEKQLANIRTLFANEKYDEAFKIAKELVINNIENNELNLELAKIYFVKKDYKNSEEIFLRLQKDKDFFVVSTEMLQKIYKILGLYLKSVIQFYKLNRYFSVTKNNIEDAIDSVLALRRYDTFFKIMFIAKNKKIYFQECIDIQEIYKEIVKLISEYNSKYLYDSVKILYRKIIKYVPQSETKIRNILLNEYEIATGCYRLASKPRSLTLELTNKCNLKCIMCEYKKVKKHWEISDNVYNELLALIPYLENLILQGGEVFLYKNIENILKVAIEEKVSVEIVTNGLLLNEKILNILIKGKSIITFSIDSIKKDVYESIRVNGKFEKLIENLNELFKIKKSQKNDMFLRLHMVVMKKNYGEIEDIINFAGKYGFSEVYLEPVANKYIEREESIFELGYDREIVSLLEKKKNVFTNLAKKNNIKLINHLPSVNYCDSICSKNYSDIYNQETKKIKDFLWIFKLRKEYSVLSYNYANKIYDKEIICSIAKFNNNKMFCYSPWQKLSIYNKNISLPTCFCPIQFNKIKLNPVFEKLVNIFFSFLYKKNFIMSEWNSKQMLYYRKTMILQKEKKVCAKDCLENRIVLQERNIGY